MGGGRIFRGTPSAEAWIFATNREVDVPRRHGLRARPTNDGQMPKPAEDALFPGGGLPAPETLKRRRSIQLVAVLALVVNVVYLYAFRGFRPVDGVGRVVSGWERE
jgi:hypothetical protein